MVVISLGTNLGNRLDNLSNVVSKISQRCLKNLRSSIVLETDAIVPEGAPESWNIPYLNMIVSGTSHLSPHDLLHELKLIEREIGRPEIYDRWSPRIIDLDILLYDDLRISEDHLTIPHKELNNRPFFLHLLALMNISPWSEQFEFKNTFTKTFSLDPKFVGVVNITEDSFSDGGKYQNIEEACRQIVKLNQDGAAIIELGAQSTKAGAKILSIDEEYRKLDEVLIAAKSFVDANKIKISVDTYNADVALKLLQKHNISMINNVGNMFDDNALKAISEAKCDLCFVHSLNAPVVKENVMKSPTVVQDLIDWRDRCVDKFISVGFDESRLVFDTGIGFGKTSYQSLNILKNLQYLRSDSCKLMIGHSRKSFIRAFSDEKIAANRDLETIAISQEIFDHADFVRVHNVKDNMKSAVVHQLLK